MNRVMGISVMATEMRTKHKLEIEVEFIEPCTQLQAQNIVLDALGDLLYGKEIKTDSEV